MKVLKATEEQKQQLEGIYKSIFELSFSKDSFGNWIVGENVIEAPEFEEIKEQLKELERIEYMPVIE